MIHTILNFTRRFNDLALVTGGASDEVLRFVTKWLEMHPRLHVIMVPPLYRYIPATYKDDVNVFMVRIRILSVFQAKLRLWTNLGFNPGIL